MLTEALFKAAAKKDSAQVQALIGQGAVVDGLNWHRRTPLFEAIFSRDLSTIKALLTAGAKVNHEDKDKLKPLQLAISHYPECRHQEH